VSGGECVFILLVAVIGLSRQSHDFDENKQLDHESTINFPLIAGFSLNFGVEGE